MRDTWERPPSENVSTKSEIRNKFKMAKKQNSKQYDLEELEKERQRLMNESTELMMIFSSLMRKSTGSCLF